MQRNVISADYHTGNFIILFQYSAYETMFGWAKLKNAPVRWPVKILEKTGDTCLVFIKCDEAE